jgi:NitT/TauT family transport system ATP-binding protein
MQQAIRPRPAPAATRGSAGSVAVALSGVSRAFPRGRRRPPLAALDGVDLTVCRGEVVAVVGPSGCGKSTLLELVGGLQEPDSGDVIVAGRADAATRLAHCAHMPQPDLLLPWRGALANAALALECAGVPASEARRRAEPLFERLGLAGFERTRPAELSSGMRQRVAFLRTLLAGRPVLLLDEPFAALDAITRASMQEWLADAIASEGRTVLCVTHDIEEALFLADRVAVLSPGPGRVAAELEVDLPRPRPRRETVTDPRFVELRERAMEVLES